MLMGPIIGWYREVFVNQCDLWKSLIELFCLKTHFAHTSIVLVYRSGEQVLSRCLARSCLPQLPWGLERLRRCSVCTDSLPMDVSYKWRTGTFVTDDGRKSTDPHAQLRGECLRCKHMSGWVKRPDWIQPVAGNVSRYWFQWPIDEANVEELLGEFRQRRL